jgi:predicted alpha/beta hydrolase family esterase
MFRSLRLRLSEINESAMKRAVILHGTDGNPESNWFPWLKRKLEEQGYEVWAPLLPQNHTPNRTVYNDFLLSSEWDFTDNIVIGHSSGAVEVMNLLMDERCAHIKLGVLVSAWPKGYPTGMWDAGQFDNLFPPDGFDFDLIKSKADRLAFVHGADDPYCSVEEAKWLARQLNSEITIVNEGGHLGSKFTELPVIYGQIEPSLE